MESLCTDEHACAHIYLHWSSDAGVCWVCNALERHQVCCLSSWPGNFCGYLRENRTDEDSRVNTLFLTTRASRSHEQQFFFAPYFDTLYLFTHNLFGVNYCNVHIWEERQKKSSIRSFVRSPLPTLCDRLSFTVFTLSSFQLVYGTK